jgi:hypothetical protein
VFLDFQIKAIDNVQYRNPRKLQNRRTWRNFSGFRFEWEKTVLGMEVGATAGEEVSLEETVLM